MSTTTTAPAPATPLTDDKIGRDDRSALVCCHEPSYSEYLSGQLRKLGFKVHHASGHQQATQRVTSRLYHVTVLLENLEGCHLSKNLLLQHLCAMPTDDRRQTFVVMLCQSFTTSDPLQAYAQSVNLLVTYQDISQFGAITAAALEDYDESNRFFKAALMK